LPFVIAGQVVHQQYAVGAFFNDSTDKTVAFNAIAGAYCEMLREEIRFALRGWRDYLVGSHTVFGTACAGSNGTPTTGAGGIPGVGGVVSYTTDGGPLAMPALLYVGASRSSWNTIPLPLDLGFVGAAGCSVLTDPTFGLPLTTNAQGRVSGQLRIPADVGMLGAAVPRAVLDRRSARQPVGPDHHAWRHDAGRRELLSGHCFQVGW
jgi:hypothetical protein